MGYRLDGNVLRDSAGVYVAELRDWDDAELSLLMGQCRSFSVVCDEAFAETYQADPADPAVAGDLKLWREAWIQASAAPEQEPVAWYKPHWNGKSAEYRLGKELTDALFPEMWEPLYTRADPAEVESLRAELAEKDHLLANLQAGWNETAKRADAAERKLGEALGLLRDARDLCNNVVKLGGNKVGPIYSHAIHLSHKIAALSASAEPAALKYDDVLIPFVAMMRNELHANAGKGDRPGWLSMDNKTALLEVFYHLGKLQKAVKDGCSPGIKEYAADVANMSMMLVDINGLLEPAKGGDGEDS